MNICYDHHKARDRSFHSGDEMLLLFLPIQGSASQRKYREPYTVDGKINEVGHNIHPLDRRKSKRLCHINMLKEYHARPAEIFAPVWIDDINSLNSLKVCVVYIDDVVIYAETFDERVQGIRALLQTLSNAGLTVNVAKIGHWLCTMNMFRLHCWTG